MAERTKVELGTAGRRRVSGLATKPGRAGRPLVVCIPGGASNARYFDIPGHSFLDVAEANGFTAVALDRPGYGGSDALPAGEVTFARNAAALDDAIAELWSAHGARSPGVVIVSHSIGSAISVHLAARRPGWPLLGIALHGVNVVSPEPVIDAWASMPAGVSVVLDAGQRRAFVFGPDGTFDPDVIVTSEPAGSPCPLDELLEIVGGWTTDAPTLAAQVDVPVHYVLAQHEALWIAGPDRVAAFAGLFTRVPWIEASEMPGVGHNIDHHRLGEVLQLRQLAFALECAVRRP